MAQRAVITVETQIEERDGGDRGPGWEMLRGGKSTSRDIVTDIWDPPLLHSSWVRTSIDLVGSRVLPVIRIQVDVEGVSM